MKKTFRKVLIAAAMIAGIIGVGMNGKVVQASDNTTGTYDENKGCYITNNGYWQYQRCEGLDGSVEMAILKYQGDAPDPIMPAEIDGYPVTTVTSEAFYQNENLTMIELPRTLRDIGAGAFTRCTNLTSVTIDGNPDNMNGNIVEGMEYQIGDSAFLSCSSLTKLQLPEGITTIGSSAFQGCSELEWIVLPETVTTIGNGAFYSCSKLSQIKLPARVESLGYCAFSYCSNLASVELSPALTEIEHHTFEYCSALENIVIPEGVREIGNEAFEFCGNLKYAVIPSSVESIGVFPFFDCDDLIIYAEKDSSAMLFADNENNGVKAIPVTKATGPVSVTPRGWIYMTHDGEAEIVGYTGTFLAVEIPSDIDGISVTSVAGRVFKDMEITSLEFPESVTKLGDDLCSGCTKLDEIQFSTIMTRIGDNAFAGCSSLYRVALPSSVNYIGSHAFDGCSKLSTVIFADRDAYSPAEIEMGIYAFYNCDLDSVDIPVGVKDIGEYTFYGNKNLANVVLPEGLEHVSSHAFHGCAKIEALKLPSTLTYIWEYAFAGCEGLKEIEIPDKVTNIEQRAFVDCTALKKANILSNVKKFGTRVFENCDALTIYTNKGSVAETYAKDNEISVVLLDGSDTPEEVKIPKVSKVKSFKATAKKKALDLTWKKSSGVDGYQIRISTKKSLSGAKSITVSKSKTKYTVSKLSSKKKYYIQIRAYKYYKDAKGNKKKSYSNPVIIYKTTK